MKDSDLIDLYKECLLGVFGAQDLPPDDEPVVAMSIDCRKGYLTEMTFYSDEDAFEKYSDKMAKLPNDLDFYVWEYEDHLECPSICIERIECGEFDSRFDVVTRDTPGFDDLIKHMKRIRDIARI